MQEQTGPYGRVPSIDAFRGLAVLLMAAANFIAGIAWVPLWLKHAPDIGYTAVDTIAPMFIVSIGFTAGLSARRRRERHGASAALGGMAARYLAILGIGAVISAGEGLLMADGKSAWGVLQAIGAAGLLTLTVIYAPAWARALAGMGLLLLYQWLLDSFFLQAVLASPHNGLIGSVSWAGLLMLATAAADGFFGAKTPVKRALVLLLCGAGALAAGFFLSQWFPISKNRASASYMLVSLGVSLLVLLLAHGLLEGRPHRFRPVQAVGRNPLAMYLAHLLLLGFVALPGAPGWYAEAPWWLAALQGAALICVLIGLGGWMDRKGLVLKL